MQVLKEGIELLIVSGRSGAGKSSVLHMLEDMGYYCIDNLPLNVMVSVVEQTLSAHMTNKMALGVDVRTWQTQEGQAAETIAQLSAIVDLQVVFLTAQDSTLLARYASTRRTHPLMQQAGSLLQALQLENLKLAPFAKAATMVIDTTNSNVHQLQATLVERLQHAGSAIIVLQSFGFKFGSPLDADMVFDARHLPNPHWDITLRSFTGLDAPVQSFLAEQSEFMLFYQDVLDFLQTWLPKYVNNNRPVLTVAIGCTGGKHRSVYLIEKLNAQLQLTLPLYKLQVVHRQQADW